MEANYPYAIKNQRSNVFLCSKALTGVWMQQAGSLWHKIAGVATPWNSPLHQGGTDCFNK